VTRKIISDALDQMNRVLDLAGGRPASVTELEDGSVTQVVDINPIVRRSRTIGRTTGIFNCVLENVHGAGATSESSSIDPYNAGGLNVNGYPQPVPDDMDVWVLRVSVFISVATGSNLTTADYFLRTAAEQQGLSSDDGGLAVSAAIKNLPRYHWDTVTTSGAVQNGISGAFCYDVPERIRRGANFRFESVATNAVETQCVLVCGLFPIGLGQDVI